MNDIEFSFRTRSICSLHQDPVDDTMLKRLDGASRRRVDGDVDRPLAIADVAEQDGRLAELRPDVEVPAGRDLVHHAPARGAVSDAQNGDPALVRDRRRSCHPGRGRCTGDPAGDDAVRQSCFECREAESQTNGEHINCGDVTAARPVNS
jgi:hypothetical protein